MGNLAHCKRSSSHDAELTDLRCSEETSETWRCHVRSLTETLRPTTERKENLSSSSTVRSALCLCHTTQRENPGQRNTIYQSSISGFREAAIPFVLGERERRSAGQSPPAEPLRRRISFSTVDGCELRAPPRNTAAKASFSRHE